MRRSLWLALALALDACGGNDLPGPSTTCSPSGIDFANLCPDAKCPPTWTTDTKSWCPSNPTGHTTLRLVTDCSGYNVAIYGLVDTGTVAIYKASDGSFLGIESWFASGGGLWSCVPGVPATLKAYLCSPGTGAVACP